MTAQKNRMAKAPIAAKMYVIGFTRLSFHRQRVEKIGGLGDGNFAESPGK